MPGSPAEALGAAESPRGHSPAILQCGGLAGIGLVLAQTGREICEVDSMISGASAHACGLIHPGDKLLSVNGRDVRSACMQVSLSAIQSRLPSPLPPCFSHASFRASLRLSHPRGGRYVREFARSYACTALARNRPRILSNAVSCGHTHTGIQDICRQVIGQTGTLVELVLSRSTPESYTSEQALMLPCLPSPRLRAKVQRHNGSSSGSESGSMHEEHIFSSSPEHSEGDLAFGWWGMQLPVKGKIDKDMPPLQAQALRGLYAVDLVRGLPGTFGTPSPMQLPHASDHFVRSGATWLSIARIEEPTTRCGWCMRFIMVIACVCTAFALLACVLVLSKEGDGGQQHVRAAHSAPQPSLVAAFLTPVCSDLPYNNDTKATPRSFVHCPPGTPRLLYNDNRFFGKAQCVSPTLWNQCIHAKTLKREDKGQQKTSNQEEQEGGGDGDAGSRGAHGEGGARPARSFLGVPFLSEGFRRWFAPGLPLRCACMCVCVAARACRCACTCVCYGLPDHHCVTDARVCVCVTECACGWARVCVGACG